VRNRRRGDQDQQFPPNYRPCRSKPVIISSTLPYSIIPVWCVPREQPVSVDIFLLESFHLVPLYISSHRTTAPRKSPLLRDAHGRLCPGGEDICGIMSSSVFWNNSLFSLLSIPFKIHINIASLRRRRRR
jgi:hypothetical protein